MDLKPNDEAAALLRALAAHPFVVGLGGGLLSLKALPPGGFRVAAFHLLLGGVIAGACTDGVVEYLHVSSTGMRSALAFLLGAFGILTYVAAVEAVRTIKWGALLESLLPAWLGRGKQGGEDGRG